MSERERERKREGVKTESEDNTLINEEDNATSATHPIMNKHKFIRLNNIRKQNFCGSVETQIKGDNPNRMFLSALCVYFQKF